jgi:hypothetical protein
MKHSLITSVDSAQPEIFMGQGRQTAAAYLDTGIGAYRGNPFIEALPPILTEDQAMEALARYPPYNKNERRMPSHLRLHAIQNALQCFVPLPVHLDLEQRFSRMIRAGYQNRNPFSLAYWRNIDEGCKQLGSSITQVQNSARAVPLGFTIIGFPGVGKSTSVEAILSLYPQVIFHQRYASRDFHTAQIVWLKLECPHNRSTKGLCINFFQLMDQLLGTRYQHNYSGGRRTADELLPNMARVAAMHGVGVLVIDEINRLSGSSSGGTASMLSFFVQLTNTLGIPVVLVGTYKARFVLSGEFHQIRRGTGQGDLVWDRMEEGKWIEKLGKFQSEKLGVWQLFLESIWTYQYTAVPVPLTSELSHALYEETQGITDFAAKVYMLAQIRTIVTASAPKQEVLTADVIRSVARDSLKQAQPVLSALRRNDTTFLHTVPDVHPIEIDKYITEAQNELRERPLSLVSNISNNASLLEPESEKTQRKNVPPLTKTKSKRPRKKGEAFDADDLRAALLQDSKSSTGVYETLKSTGHIVSAIDYLKEEEPSV